MNSEISKCPASTTASRSWWSELNAYHKFVLWVAILGWLFDAMDQQLFNIARVPAMRALLATENEPTPSPEAIGAFGGYATSIFLLGWASGGVLFGILGDLIGRAKTMQITILVYSLFTGFSAISRNFEDFAIYRFLTGLGVGGEFAVGVSLVAEVMPDRARPFALALLQSLSTVGAMLAGLIGMFLASFQSSPALTSAARFLAAEQSGGTSANQTWRLMFLVGATPALLVILIRRRLQEPEVWRQAAAKSSLGGRLRSYYAEIFGNPRWAKHAVIGLLLASSGVIGLWGIAYFSVDLQRSVFRSQYEQAHLDPVVVSQKVDFWASITTLTLLGGGALGIYVFGHVTHYLGRKTTFAINFLAAMLSTSLVFWKFNSIGDIFWMIPLMGFCQLALFGGYAIYFPELFPTRLRSSGVSFCYNGARFVAAVGPTALGLLTSRVFKDFHHDAIRYAGVSMCATFLVGLLVLPFAPETKGRPLPE